MAVTVKVTFRANQAGITRMMHQEGMYRHLEERADRVIAAARATAPVDTGDYRRGIGKERFSRARVAGVRVVARDPISLIVERGSRAHVIEPRDKQALHWPGARHPVKRVNHPGTPARHILRNALRAAGG